MTPAPPIISRTTRLAPSPTGALHLGNARTFLITWALARRESARIILRVEDLDTPRVKTGVTEATIDTLRWLGLDWDEDPFIQSDDLTPYAEAMNTLARNARAYPSDATRGDIEAAASAPQEGVHETPFPASLRPPLQPREFDDRSINWRFAAPAGPVRFHDEFAGAQQHDPSQTVGDFVIWTKRAQPAYQLAVVVDDHRQGVNLVIRGNDLLDSAARQLLLYDALGYRPRPSYLHLPLVRGPDGKRLAKRHGDTRLDSYRKAGVPPERVIGVLACWSGVSERPEPMPAGEFARRFDLARLSPNDVVFTQENHQWLLGRHA